MPRRPLFDKAMTAAERQRRRRARLELSKPHKWRTMTDAQHRSLTLQLLKDLKLVPADTTLPEHERE